MFTPYEQRAAGYAVATAPGSGWRARLHGPAPDLARDIGSRRWLRGFATLFALIAAALLFWPDFAPVAAAPMRVAPDVLAEMRAQGIAPLALGGDSGRHAPPGAALVALAAAPERPSVQLTATLGQGDGLARMLQRAGVGGDDALRVAALVAGEVPPGEIAPGTRFALTLGRRASPTVPRPLEALAFRAKLELALAIERRPNGALALVRTAIPVDATPVRFRGIVGASLYRSARAAGAPPRAIQQYLRALDQHLSLGQDVLPADEFDIVVEHKRAAGGEAATGDVLYAGLDRGGQPRARLLRWGGTGEGTPFYEASGVGPRRAGLGMPVAGRITSGFGLRRHPLLGFTRMHSGIDFGARYGSPVYATSDGVVTYAGWHGGHGNFVRLAHGGGIGTGYGHLSRIAVANGMQVRRGEVIGFVGSTGLSTGPHLHYELYRDGRPVDPGSVQFVTRAGLPPEELAAFRARLAQLLTLTPGG